LECGDYSPVSGAAAINGSIKGDLLQKAGLRAGSAKSCEESQHPRALRA
jgi:hypothetical protein